MLSTFDQLYDLSKINICMYIRKFQYLPKGKYPVRRRHNG